MGSNADDKPVARSGVEDTVPAAGSGVEETVLATDHAPVVDPDASRGRPSLPPTMSRRYQLGAEIGRGGMGRVVEAYDTQLGRVVALKEVLPKGDGIARRFVREIEITARLEHASIVPIYDSGTTPDGRPFYVMRRVSGRPLDQLIRGARDLGERLTLLPNLLAAIDAVAHAHRRGVIHRDLKPSNILVGELGETVVIDWGLAKVIGEEEIVDDPTTPVVPSASDSLRTEIGAVFGTPGFMAPEQARGEELDTRGDVYALGGSLYHLLAGRPPHTGSSATEAMNHTLQHTLTPLDDIAPGAPPELVAITEKAMGFEAADRYPTAGALAEDVRRFLEGQLVAAHRYTRGQRLARFARRHRTALVVAALGTILVTALAWWSVRRVVAERDAATVARREAVERQREAEAARDRLADRNDALLVARARAAITTNPTEALAWLKQLDPGSSRMQEARGVALEGVARGVWWALPASPGGTSRLEISSDGRFVLEVGMRARNLQVWDLDRKRRLLSRKLAGSARWVGDQILVYGKGRPAQWLEPATNRITEDLGAAIWEVDVGVTGDRALVEGDGEVAWLDLRSHARTPVGERSRVFARAISPDGGYAVISWAQGTVVYDPMGAVVARTPLVADRLAASTARRFAMTIGRRLVECTFEDKVACRDLELPSFRYLSDLRYRDSSLAVVFDRGVYEFVDDPRQRVRYGDGEGLLHLADHGMLAVASMTGETTFFGSGASTTVRPPTPMNSARVALHPHGSRLVIAGQGTLLVTDTRILVPRHAASQVNLGAVFVDEDTLFLSRATEWAWLDVPARRETAGGPVQLAQHNSILDTFDRRVLVVDFPSGLSVHAKGSPPIAIPTGYFPEGLLMGGDAVVFTMDQSGAASTYRNGGLIQWWHDGSTELLAKLDGEIRMMVRLDPWTVVALTSTHQLAHISLRTKAVERVQLAVGDHASIARTLDDRLVVVDGKRLYRWDNALVLVTEFAHEIEAVLPVADRQLVVTLDNLEGHLVRFEPGARPELMRLTSTLLPQASADGRRLLWINGAQVLIVDLSTGARWSPPTAAPAMSGLTLSPSGRRLAVTVAGQLQLWELPVLDDDLYAWIEDHTNATITNGDMLTWPWQRPAGN